MGNQTESKKYVPFGLRLKAFLWDYIFILAYIILLSGFSFFAQPFLFPLFRESPLSAEITGFLLITLPVSLYFVISEGSPLHATWGKRKTGIIVTDQSNRPVGFGRSLFRTALKFAPWELAHFTIWNMILPSPYSEQSLSFLLISDYVLILIYLISPFINKKNRTVYDFLSGTAIRYKE
ncbi:RDD family protein [Fictibacillus fluitans]|uniref:RDD family protein n=1 Tax=Fictibacillus fluitans TaxID=3058422 RepID=A0ABT8HQ84_9BACL|nr:RDD family protein [Fictibacillus sp. NE201]MDN4522930.1 RDD family protein [Fictibacillus sp. NE201]